MSGHWVHDSSSFFIELRRCLSYQWAQSSAEATDKDKGCRVVSAM